MNNLTAFDLAKQYLEAKDLVKKLKQERKVFAEFGGKCDSDGSGLCYDRYSDSPIPFEDYCPYCKTKTEMSIEIKYASRQVTSAIRRLRTLVQPQQNNI